MITLHIHYPSPTDQDILTQELLSLPLHSNTLRVRGRRSDRTGGMTSKDQGCHQKYSPDLKCLSAMQSNGKVFSTLNWETIDYQLWVLHSTVVSELWRTSHNSQELHPILYFASPSSHSWPLDTHFHNAIHAAQSGMSAHTCSCWRMDTAHLGSKLAKLRLNDLQQHLNCQPTALPSASLFPF